MGKGGAVASDGKSFWRIPAIEVAAISAIGSGDAFSAGLASGIAAGKRCSGGLPAGGGVRGGEYVGSGGGVFAAWRMCGGWSTARVEKW